MALNDEAQLAVITTKLDRVSQDVKDINDMVKQNYVTQDQFRPVRIFVYGLIGIALTTIGVAVINLIIVK